MLIRIFKFYNALIFTKIQNWWTYLHVTALLSKSIDPEPVLRSELYSSDQMKIHIKDLAATHTLATEHYPDELLARLIKNEKVLFAVYYMLAETNKESFRIDPAGEWLLDNFHLIEEQIHTAKRHLPKHYSQELPQLRCGFSAKLPRVYDIALETISHGDGRIDQESLLSFISAYQDVTPLKLGELWAIPIMLRLALIENLRRIGARIGADWFYRTIANKWADKIIKISEKDPKNLILEVAEMARSDIPMTSSFVAEFARRLHGQNTALTLPLTWIEQQLLESGHTIEQLIRVETQKQASDQVTVSNSISSLRFLGAMDWHDFVETLSVVENILRKDPSGVYSKMDFITRDHYRHVIEKTAKRCQLSELEVAKEAILLALTGKSDKGRSSREAHVGYYLIDKGISILQQNVRAKIPKTEALRLLISRVPLAFYLGLIVLLTLILSGLSFWVAYTKGVSGWGLPIIAGLLLLGISQLAVSLVNWISTLLIAPHPLPRMDYSKEIAPESRTLVVVPTMLISKQGTQNLVEALEIRFLANRNKNLHFALLTDFKDAHSERTSEDEQLLNHIEENIKLLNEKYKAERTDIFFLFHRPRRFNPGEKLWMGYERKRGKIADLNLFLRGLEIDRFSLVVGKTEILTQVKYVITLDTDTGLPRDSAYQLVAAMAHPLNKATYNEKKHRVTEGYGILQPRVAVNLLSLNRSRYARLWGGETGIDPYTRTVSDVYQDLFSEGSFIGKGIYDVDVFNRALEGRFPENRILSHDLLEGCLVRSGFLSDIVVYEGYPSSYIADATRRHRWIRGDWQLVMWPKLNSPDSNRGSQRNPLSLLSRWKLFDNHRRSLVTVALLLLLILGWIIFPFPVFWTLLVLGIIMLPPLVTPLSGINKREFGVKLHHHFIATVHLVASNIAQAGFNFACLPYEAFFSMDAILRTLWRLIFSNKHLLEWNPDNNQDLSNHLTLTFFYQRMWISPIIAIAIIFYLSFFKSGSLGAASPILILWLIAPVLAWWLSKPLPLKEVRLSKNQNFFLRKLARKTWDFFETFVGAEDHFLPPDNYQEDPAKVIAHRTSPTNIGLALLGNLAAFDFGYISNKQLVDRTLNTLRTMQKLERFKGHFYNWYDTHSLKPLSPLYVSTVDSGNLVGHLLTLRAGLNFFPDKKILSTRLFEGLKDTLMMLTEMIAPSKDFDELEKKLLKILTTSSFSLKTTRLNLELLLSTITKNIAELEVDAPAKWWAELFQKQCMSHLEDLTYLAPWTTFPLPSADVHQGLSFLDEIPSFQELSRPEDYLFPKIDKWLASQGRGPNQTWTIDLKKNISEAASRAKAMLLGVENLIQQLSECCVLDFTFLYDESRHLLAIGYNVSEHRQDMCYYDLLASEARLATFIAIAQGQIPQESWFTLGRLLTSQGGKSCLLSWSGSMFEYLMPLLVMPSFDNTLLEQTYRAAVDSQIDYGRKRGVPWGFSESGYNIRDANHNYQYRAFGVPDMALKRGLAEDLVVAPYASLLALMVKPKEACENLENLASIELEGKFGFYEAIDYTPSRLPHWQASAIISSFMAHHQGMSLLALAYHLLGKPMQKRFESEPLFQATMLLLHERISKAKIVYSRQEADFLTSHPLSDERERSLRIFASPNTPTPQVQLLSNGKYHLMITNAGGGYSRWKNIALTRWREDTTCDNWGTFCYIRDLKNMEYWSPSHQPTLRGAKNYEAIFSESRAEFRCLKNGLATHMEITVSPEDDIEMRRLHITNRSWKRRTIDVTSYAEVVLNSPVAEELHPAFSNLFIETEIIKPQQAILCTRRPRSKNDSTPWMFHLMSIHGTPHVEVSYETSRMEFIGRNNTVVNPRAMYTSASLSGSEGAVLDPIVAIRYLLTIEPDTSVMLNIVSGIGENRERCMALIEKYHDWRIATRVFDLAWTHSQVFLKQINATEADAQLYSQLASSILYANAKFRADSDILIKNHKGQSSLWGYSISGDLPIVLVQIADSANIELVRQMLQAHTYWRLKGLTVDLVLWNEDRAGYRQGLQDQIMGLVSTGHEANMVNRPGGIFVRSGDQISNEDRILFQSVARVIITDSRGTLEKQIKDIKIASANVPQLTPIRTYRPETSLEHVTTDNKLIFYNGYGGFTPDGKEYVILNSLTEVPPVPWVNVLSNQRFGTIISDNGLSCTWFENAHEFRLTPWGNDPISDFTGEAIYLRDEESGHFWSPTPKPCRGEGLYTIRHGFGYSVFEHIEDGLSSELWVYVATDAAIKFMALKVRNNSGRYRRLSATGYIDWVLGDLKSKSAMHIVTEIDSDSGAIFAKNPYHTEFADRVGFFDVNSLVRSVTCDRTEFLGRNGSLQNPAAMTQVRLSGKLGTVLDPCAAIQVPFDLADREEREIIFKLGAGKDTSDARNLAERFHLPSNALMEVFSYWNKTLGSVQVETPDPALNVMANGWLLYQTLSCRLWARNGYYQSGGAFGFRDQLQDVMSLVHTTPQIVRDHILLAAAHQFIEGDVLHWWHPPSGRGVRTRCSDDYLWLPFVVCRYVVCTGDTGVLSETIPFIEGRQVNMEEESYYDLPVISHETASLYEHCVRALVHGLNFGQKNLPLIGSGDWNDGMNLVGIKGKGESVWLGFFLYTVLMQFSEIARLKNDLAFVERCQNTASILGENLEKNAWDGAWYRRAYFDEGEPLGSASNEECQIDSIAQSWAALSKAADLQRARMAMNAVDKHLVHRELKLIQLLTPPFNTAKMDPGYIKGYVPGVRENGGGYTHAAIWVAMAFAALGDSEKAWEFFDMINPVNHSRKLKDILTYKVEPYVVASDIYSVSPHAGRGGWTWYTGSSGWLYRLIIESLLGLRLENNSLRFEPCLKQDWSSYKLHYRFKETVYHINVINTHDKSKNSQLTLDGVFQEAKTIPLIDDHKEHYAELNI